MVLLGKWWWWWWRLKEEHECLWYKVLSARYGEEGVSLLRATRGHQFGAIICKTQKTVLEHKVIDELMLMFGARWEMLSRHCFSGVLG